MKKFTVLLAVIPLCVALLAGCDGNIHTSAIKAGGNSPASSMPEIDGKTLLDIDFDTDESYNQNVYITNGTGVAIIELYMSKSDVDVWEDDLLQGTSFPNGSTKMFVAGSNGTARTTWDFCIVDEEGDEIFFWELNLSTATELKFHWGDGRTPSVTITQSGGRQYVEEGWFEEPEAQAVTGSAYYNQNIDITNKTGVAILEIYISLSDDRYWGNDLLDGRVFSANETMGFTTEKMGDTNTTWDIKIVDEDGDIVTFSKISFSRSSGIILSWGNDGYTPTVNYTD